MTVKVFLYERDGKPNEANWMLVTAIFDVDGSHVGGTRSAFHSREQAEAAATERGLEVAA